MEQQTDSFIDKNLEQYFADLLYSVKLGDREAYLYILFEHKSYDDRQVVFQMLEYIAKIYRKQKKEKPTDKVPVVIPIVIFHAKEKWKQPFNLLEYMDLDLERESSLIPYIPNFTYRFYDITRMEKSDEFYTILKNANLSMREDYMTLAQSWENEGIAKGQLKTALNLIKMGMDLLTISKATELPLEEIKKLTEKNNR